MTISAAPTISRRRRIAVVVSAAAIPMALLLPSGIAGASPIGPIAPALPVGGVPVLDGPLEFTPVWSLPVPEPSGSDPWPIIDLPPYRELLPDLPDDFTIPTFVCNAYDADFFSVAVGPYDDDLLEVQLSYSDVDVCDFTVWTSYWNTDDLGAGAASSSSVGMEAVAFSTDSAGYYQLTIPDQDFCNWEVRVAVEEGLPEHYPGSDDCDDAPGDDPGDDPGDEPGDDPGDDPGEEIEERTLGGDDSSTPGPGLPRTGTDGTSVMLGLGLLTLGFGSIIALLTRRRAEVPAV